MRERERERYIKAKIKESYKALEGRSQRRKRPILAAEKTVEGLGWEA